MFSARTHVNLDGPQPANPDTTRMDIWPRCLERLETEFPPEDVQTWLRPLQARSEGTSAVLYAPNVFIRDIVEARYLPKIRELFGHFGGHTDVRLDIGSSSAPPPATAAHTVTTPARSEKPFVSNLNPYYTFNNFIVGRSNQWAQATVLQVAENPGARVHNPLLLYGSTGLGKTHLMFAAGNRMRQLRPGSRVLYLRSNEFWTAFFRALQRKKADEFKQKFQQIDALLIDDVHLFVGKDATQEEFFHTFNQLFEGQQQIIMTCDRHPREVTGLEQRLRSRMTWGVSIAIDPPDFETRAAIVLAKAREQQVRIPDDVAFLLAKNMRSNVRDLEGALNTLVAQSKLSGKPISVNFAQETLRDLLRAQQQAISIANIQKTVARHYGLSVDALLSRSRTQTLARARQVAMALAKELTEDSLPAIGKAFGNRNHTTVLHACKHVQQLMQHDGSLHHDWDHLIRQLSE